MPRTVGFAPGTVGMASTGSPLSRKPGMLSLKISLYFSLSLVISSSMLVLSSSGGGVGGVGGEGGVCSSISLCNCEIERLTSSSQTSLGGGFALGRLGLVGGGVAAGGEGGEGVGGVVGEGCEGDSV